MSNLQTTEYKEFIKRIKLKARQAQIRASVKVNSTLIEFYWELGEEIVLKQKNTNWGSGFLKNMSRDLMDEFPEVKGFSKRNLEFIRKWYLYYSQKDSIMKQVVSQLALIPWGHNIVIIQKSKNITEALFYVQKTIENGWSRVVLRQQIVNQLFKREGKALTTFSTTLPQAQSDLANELTKDPYQFDFLTLREKYNERELEDALKDINKPIGVSEYQLSHVLPKEFKSTLPSIEEIEEELKSLE